MKEGGDLSTGFLGARRLWLLANIAITVALLPAVFTGRGASTGPIAVAAGETLRTVPVVATATPGDDRVVVLGPTDIAAAAATTTTTTTVPPTTTTVRKVIVRKVAPAPKPVTRPKQVVPPKPAPAPTASARSQSGKASWYDHRAGICAHRTLPMGTVVTVTNVANGRSTRCTVGDRGPYVAGWVIDLHPQEFRQLAPVSAGVISVRLNW